MRTIIGIIGAGLLICHCLVTQGCGILGSRVGAMADTVGYERALDDCLKEAHRLGRSRAVYDQCAGEADIRYGVREGGAP